VDVFLEHAGCDLHRRQRDSVESAEVFDDAVIRGDERESAMARGHGESVDCSQCNRLRCGALYDGTDRSHWMSRVGAGGGAMPRTALAKRRAAERMRAA